MIKVMIKVMIKIMIMIKVMIKVIIKIMIMTFIMTLIMTWIMVGSLQAPIWPLAGIGYSEGITGLDTPGSSHWLLLRNNTSANTKMLATLKVYF